MRRNTQSCVPGMHYPRDATAVTGCSFSMYVTVFSDIICVFGTKSDANNADFCFQQTRRFESGKLNEKILTYRSVHGGGHSVHGEALNGVRRDRDVGRPLSPQKHCKMYRVHLP